MERNGLLLPAFGRTDGISMGFSDGFRSFILGFSITGDLHTFSLLSSLSATSIYSISDDCELSGDIDFATMTVSFSPGLKGNVMQSTGISFGGYPCRIRSIVSFPPKCS